MNHQSFEDVMHDLSQTEILAVSIRHSSDWSEAKFTVRVRAEDAEKFLNNLQTSSRHLRNLDATVATAIEETGGSA